MVNSEKDSFNKFILKFENIKGGETDKIYDKLIKKHSFYNETKFEKEIF